MFDDFGWIAANKNIIRHIFSNHASCRHHGVLTNGDTRANDRANANPGIFLNRDFF